MRADRLLKLADYLETVPRKQFDMEKWTNEARGCGFSGCAVGWAIHGRLFKGFGWSKDAFWGWEPIFEGALGSGAVEYLFDLEERDATGLFMRNKKDDATPKQVANRIRKFVRENSK